MQLNPAEISELIKSRIEGLSANADVRNQGTVISVTDGIVRIHGLSDVMQGEMLEFPGNTFGLALNLERDSVGAVILGYLASGSLITAEMGAMGVSIWKFVLSIAIEIGAGAALTTFVMNRNAR